MKTTDNLIPKTDENYQVSQFSDSTLEKQNVVETQSEIGKTVFGNL